MPAVAGVAPPGARATSLADVQLTLRAMGAGMSVAFSARGWRVAIVRFADGDVAYTCAVAPDVETAFDAALRDFCRQQEGRVVA